MAKKSSLRDNDRFSVVYFLLTESFFASHCLCRVPYMGAEIVFAVLRNSKWEKHAVCSSRILRNVLKTKDSKFSPATPALLNDLRLTLAYSKYAMYTNFVISMKVA